jgi:hypothetical protein
MNNTNTANIPQPSEMPYDWVGINTPCDLATEQVEREEILVQQVRDDWAAAQELHEREEREREEVEAHAYVGWAGDGSGLDDLADLGEQEGWDN